MSNSRLKLIDEGGRSWGLISINLKENSTGLGGKSQELPPSNKGRNVGKN